MTTTIYVAIAAISIAMMLAQAQLFRIKDLLTEIRDQGKAIK